MWPSHRISKKRKKERKDDVFESEAHLRAWLDGCLDERTVADVTSLYLHNGESTERQSTDETKIKQSLVPRRLRWLRWSYVRTYAFFSPSVVFKFLWLLKTVVRSSLTAWLQCSATLSISCVVFVELWRSIRWLTLTLRSTVVVL